MYHTLSVLIKLYNNSSYSTYLFSNYLRFVEYVFFGMTIVIRISYFLLFLIYISRSYIFYSTNNSNKCNSQKKLFKLKLFLFSITMNITTLKYSIIQSNICKYDALGKKVKKIVLNNQF